MTINSVRHIRWNWEQSSEQDADNRNYVRYHFIIIDNKNRETILNKITASLSQYGEIIPVRETEGKVAETKFRYLFKSFDSTIRPDMLNFSFYKNKPIRRDSDLKERKRGNIEDYVANLYS